MTDSFLEAYQTFCQVLPPAEADQFVQEQSKIGELLGVTDLPLTAADLRAWITNHPDLDESGALQQAWSFLRNPPLQRGQLLGYRVVRAAALATLPPNLAQLGGETSRKVAVFGGQRLISSLRWAMKHSPAWKAALDRCGSSYDTTKFRSFEDPS